MQKKESIIQPKMIPPVPAMYTKGGKITSRHLQRLATVYIRQSTPQQMIRHQESTQVQYQLKYRALALGWPQERIEIIDEDLGQSGASTESRTGFQRLVAEVTLDHVGIIFGVEMSRLARSCRDWHQLLEVCALFGTLIADLDGIYDPCHYNDRLLLGLKGTLSEAELHILKQRMIQGKLNKARRGELLFSLPIGYVRRLNGEVGLDPDEQVQTVVRLIFKKFEELGTVGAVLRYLTENNIQMGVRLRGGLRKGEIQWRRCYRTRVRDMIKNPMYAGAYVYGRRKVDPRRKIAGQPYSGKRLVALHDCEVLLKDRFPAYISWEQFERNQDRLRQNRSIAESMGSVRRGAALLSGLLVCQKCNRRMAVWYNPKGKSYRYWCNKMLIDYGDKACQGLSGPALDSFITEQMFTMLNPASLRLSLEAAEDLEKERQRLEVLWQNRLERCRYASERAQRQHSVVEPENRLVARQLEKEWEEKLSEQKKLEMEYERFLAQRPRLLTEKEREAISLLAVDIPALWHDEGTTVKERKEILRQVIDRIIIDVVGKTERCKVDIHWAGGLVSKLEMIRPVARLEQLSNYPEMTERIKQLFEQELTAVQIAEQMNKEGWQLTREGRKFTRSSVVTLVGRLGLTRRSAPSEYGRKIGQDEWWLAELARELDMPIVSLYKWIGQGLVKARRHEGWKNQWVVWADSREVDRLRQVRSESRGGRSSHKNGRNWFERLYKLAQINNADLNN